MENPFFTQRGWYNQPDPTRYAYSHPRRVPTHSVHRSQPSRVVQIPIHFVGSVPLDRSGAAVRIQKFFRGFLVRKSMERINEVKMWVDEIEEKLSRSEVVDSIRSDEKERLRMSERLMALLLKLDSIRGFDLGVRDCRKSVIRRVIRLQEKVDSIVAVDLGENGEEAENEEQDFEPRVSEENRIGETETEIGVSVEGDGSNQVDNQEKSHESMEVCDGKLEDFVENLDDSVKESENGGDEGNDDGLNGKESEEKEVHCDDTLDGSAETLDQPGEVRNVNHFAGDVSKDGEIENVIDVGVDCEVKVSEVHSDNVSGRSLAESDGKDVIDGWVLMEGDEGRGGNESSKRNNELMERITEDNKKMMNMMAQLFEKNEKQMRMLNSLTHRVDMLEKAFLCDKQRKKKKKN